MRKLSLLLFCISLLTITNLNILAQTGELSGIKLNLAAGEVVEINKEANKVTVKTKDGNIDAVIASTTVFKRVPPSDKIELKNAVDSNLSEVNVGDKVLITGMVADDKKTIPAKNFYLLSKSDLAKRDAAEKEMWRTKGVFGKVDSVDLRSKQIVLNVTSPTGQQKVTVTPKDNVSYLRYTEESVKYADAKPSSFAEIKVGDQVRALGEKSEDGLKLQAEEVVSGAFRTVVGAITAVDVAKNEVTIKDLQTNKLVTVVVTSNSQLKAFPKEMATMMAGRMGGGQGTFQGGGMQPPQGGQGGGNVMVRQPQGAGQGSGQGEGQRGQGGQSQGGMRRMGGGANINDMYENLPKTTVAELKIGDQIGVSSTASITTDRLTAIKLLAGVEPFIAMQQMANAANAARNGQNAPTINIPGLDGGFGAP